jgi:hypothetical protein
MPLDQAGIREHIFNILTEAGFETAGDLMLTMKLDPNKVLALAGVGPKAMESIEQVLAALQFPEPEPVPVETEAVVTPVEEVAAAPEAQAEPVTAETALEPTAVVAEKAEGDEGEFAKDGVSLDELFKIKPEIFQTATETEDDDAAGKGKGKKGKKKSVELEYDEELGAVVGRKMHKRGDEDPTEGVW